MIQYQIETALKNFRGDGYFGEGQLPEGKSVFRWEKKSLIP